MKKFFAALLIVGSLFFVSTAQAEVKTYEGVGEYVMGERDTLETAKQGAKDKALRNALERAGVLIQAFARTEDSELVEDVITSQTGAILKVVEITYDREDFLVKAHVWVEIDADDINRRLEEISRKPKNASPSKTSQIPSDAVKYNGHSYKLIDMGLTWKEAKAYCESLGGHLVTITSGMEQTFVQDLIVNRGTKGYYWTGGTKNSSGNFVWITGENFSYMNWGNGEPDNHGGIENSIAIYKYEGLNGIWFDVWDKVNDNSFYNFKNSGFVCEWDS